MPRTITEGFSDFLEKLKPSAVESAGAKSHRASIETCLKDKLGLRRFARIGSFGNGTSISGFSDVDYLASIPTEQLTQTSTASLEKVRRILDERFPRTGVAVRCPAISAPFGGTAADNTEVVPADYLTESNGYKVYDIADCSGGWMNASPDAHNDYVRAVDEKHYGKVKPLIRFVKAWKYLREVPISSFYIELRVAKYADGEKSIVYDIDVKRVLCQLRDCSLASMQDPMGVSGLISACKTDAKWEDAMSKLKNAATRADRARDCEMAGKTSEAFDWWRLVYGDLFPTYYRT
jgi:hypothetical protein